MGVWFSLTADIPSFHILLSSSDFPLPTMHLSIPQKPRPGRRWEGGRPPKTSARIILTMTIMVMLSIVSRGNAQDQPAEAQSVESALFRELAERGEIHIDTREPPSRRDISRHKRQDGVSVIPTTISAPTATSAATSLPPDATVAISTETAAPLSPSAVSTSTSPTITVVTTPLPSPFDTSIGTNFTDTACPQFFSRFLSNSTFQSCIPVSLMLQNSNSFFRAERSTTLLAQTLDSACNAPLAICSPLLANLAAELIDDANCGPDYRQQNPLVAQAYAGLIAYEPIYRATCLRDTDTDSGTTNYCFAEALTNSSNSADSYVYYTALGMNMPSSARPSCTPCLRDTMKMFAGYAENAVQPLSRTYLACANQVDVGCGADFVATDIKVGSTGRSSAASSVLRRQMSSYTLTIGSTVSVVLWSILLG
ncbi:hypothetical protein A1O1_05536 [Capronia coronata CBS 617.96]|uniref:DUF7729 domain-containing protein n=1 Tax=Capronia coronata CBS 617.96 TaxID=1182541 RepID=W9YH62_9EURO|nr:uncharacterized protein A1O1_05536 [Capronia coronata CBS 617.96]EXJ88606.1 hypothetical protein A1O1_05536 [Capronia coronata CBS 617.96]